MDPGYFALVMATGIVSNAFLYLSHDRLSDVLFGITLVAFPALFACFVVRVLVRPRAVWGDLVDPRLVFFLPVDAAEMNPLFGPAFGALYDLSAILILCFAGSSVRR